MSKRVERCETCRFWDDSTSRNAAGEVDTDIGECRRYPPTLPFESAVEEDVTAQWPTTFPRDWCGEWQEVIPDVTGGEMLKHLLDAKDVTQREVSRHTGIPELRISAFAGDRRPLKIEELQKLAEYFHVNVALFFPRKSP